MDPEMTIVRRALVTDPSGAYMMYLDYVRTGRALRCGCRNHVPCPHVLRVAQMEGFLVDLPTASDLQVDEPLARRAA